MALIIALIFTVAVLTLERLWYKKKWSKNLSVHLSFGQEGVPAGEKCELVEEIVNEKRMPLATLEVKFSADASLQFKNMTNAVVTDRYYRRDLFSVEGHQKIVRRMEITATKRGYYRIRGFDLLSRNYLMGKQFVESHENETSLMVYPSRCNTNQLALIFRQIAGEAATRKDLQEDPFSFQGMREYQKGDSLRSINWKATAKSDQMLVNLYEKQSSQNFCILLDEKTDALFDREILAEEIIVIAVSIAEKLLQQGIYTAFYSNVRDVVTGEMVSIPLGELRGQMLKIDQAMAKANLKEKTDEMERVLKNISSMNKGTVFLLISSKRQKTMLKMVENYRQQGYEMYGINCYTQKEIKDLFPEGKAVVRNFVYPWEIL